MDVLLTFDRAFLIGGAVTVRTLSENAAPDRPLRVHVLHPDLNEAELEKLRASLAPRAIAPELVSHRLDASLFRGFARSKWVSLTAYGRLLAGQILPRSESRAVYVDVDVLFQPDVARLFDLDLKGNVIAAVPNGDLADQQENSRRLGKSADAYFASGLLIYDLDKWRRDHVGEAALEFAGRSPDLKLHDQDALNWVVDGKFLHLSDEWCHWASHPPMEGRPLVHYAMSQKPWHPDYASGYREEFFAAVDRTAFAGWRPSSALGIAPLFMRLRRRIPYLPTVLRLLRNAFRR